jgi:hypothetical protein
MVLLDIMVIKCLDRMQNMLIAVTTNFASMWFYHQQMLSFLCKCLVDLLENFNFVFLHDCMLGLENRD